MKTKRAYQILNVLVVTLLVFGNAMLYPSPVSAAASGSATATAISSPSNPLNGGTLTVAIHINTSAVNAPDNTLGSFDATLDWNPAIMTYSSNSGLPAGWTGNVITGSAGTGHITFNGANASGATGDTIILTITFSVIAAGTTTLDLAFQSMAAASTFTDLLPILTVTDGSVTAVNPVTVDGAVTTGSGLPAASLSLSAIQPAADRTACDGGRVLELRHCWTSISSITFTPRGSSGTRLTVV